MTASFSRSWFSSSLCVFSAADSDLRRSIATGQPIYTQPHTHTTHARPHDTHDTHDTTRTGWGGGESVHSEVVDFAFADLELAEQFGVGGGERRLLARVAAPHLVHQVHARVHEELVPRYPQRLILHNTTRHTHHRTRHTTHDAHDTTRAGRHGSRVVRWPGGGGEGTRWRRPERRSFISSESSRSAGKQSDSVRIRSNSCAPRQQCWVRPRPMASAPHIKPRSRLEG
jgi:hypothetical protein